MRRYAFFGHLVEALEGFDSSAGWAITFRDDQGHKAQLERPVVVEKLHWRRQMSVEEFTYLRGRTQKPVKVTLLSAQQAAAYYDPDKSHAAYATRDAYLADLVDFTRREIAELIRLGCEYVQIDAPQYAGLLDETIREGYRQRGSDPDKMLDATIELDNAIVAGPRRASPSASTSAAAITRACSTRPAATTGSPRRCSAGRTSTASSSSTTTSDRGRSSRCGICRTTGSWCSAWSARRRRAWRRRTT